MDRETIRRLFQAFEDRPLDHSKESDRRLYEPLYDDRHDPVTRLFDTIDFSAAQSAQLVAGFRGTGKTTEFSRLERELWANDFLVIRVDLDHYLDMHSPVVVTDFLVILAGAISDRLADERLLGKDATLRSFWERARDFLGREVELTELNVALPGVALRAGLQRDQNFRTRVRAALQSQLPRLVDEVHHFHREVLTQLRARWGDDARLVVIVDSLEHIRGVEADAKAIHDSVEELFLTHGKHLRLPETHMVFSVPAFLALKGDNLDAEYVTGAVQAWPVCRIRSFNGAIDQDSVQRMIRLIERRGDWRQILPSDDALLKLVLGSGGYIRDLLSMLIEALHRARFGVAPDAADTVIAVKHRSYLPIYADEYGVLRRIALTKDLSQVTLAERPLVMSFLDNHRVLCYLNDRFWYDVHPLVRDEVMEKPAPRE